MKVRILTLTEDFRFSLIKVSETLGHSKELPTFANRMLSF